MKGKQVYNKVYNTKIENYIRKSKTIKFLTLIIFNFYIYILLQIKHIKV